MTRLRDDARRFRAAQAQGGSTAQVAAAAGIRVERAIVLEKQRIRAERYLERIRRGRGRARRTMPPDFTAPRSAPRGVSTDYFARNTDGAQEPQSQPEE